MNQIKLLPSGAQKSNCNNLLFFGNRYIIYSSSLALYILNSSSFVVEKILSVNQKAIISISISPIDENYIAVSSFDSSVHIWNIQNELVISKVLMNSCGYVIWDPQSLQTCYFLETDRVKLFSWPIDKPTLQEIFYVRNESLNPSIIKINSNFPSLLAIGCNLGTIVVYNLKDKSHQSLRHSDSNNKVVDLEWDPFSPSYIVAAYQNFLCLWDFETKQMIHVFEKQHFPITGIVWLGWTAGTILSTNLQNQRLKTWNVSQHNSLETIKLRGDSGIQGIVVNSSKKGVLFSCEDGSVCVYNFITGRVEYKSAPGHTETIFCCKFSPLTPDIFATASYDGTIKIWKISDFSLINSFNGYSELIYCLDWSPDGKFIASSHSNGVINIWDIESGLSLGCFQNHSKASYFVSWNKIDIRYYASTSSDCSLVVSELDIDSFTTPKSITGWNTSKNIKRNTQFLHKIRFTYTHKSAVYGCAWCPQYFSILCTCSHDGTVRVFNFLSTSQLLYTLNGHQLRSFSCNWSPLIPGVLATCGDDKSILVWNLVDLSSLNIKETNSLNISPISRLLGHKGNVRALSWNFEHSHLILSGSWDCTIRVWDAFKGVCLFDINDHVSDVYSIDSHPMRPFTYISASRDTTVRVWEIYSSLPLLRSYFILGNSVDKIITDRNHSTLETQVFEKRKRSFLQYKLVGKFSQVLNILNPNQEDKSIAYRLKLIQHYKSIFNYFNGSSGYNELWDIVFQCLNNSKSSFVGPEITDSSINIVENFENNEPSKIYHRSEFLQKQTDILAQLELHLENSKPLKKSSAESKFELLSKLVDKYAKLSNFSKVCSILIKLDRWQEALALAPCVSYQFWKEMATKYASKLLFESQESCIPYLIAVGKIKEAVEFSLLRYDYEGAKTIAIGAETGSQLLHILEDNNNPNPSANPLLSEQIELSFFQSDEDKPKNCSTSKAIQDSFNLVRKVAVTTSVALFDQNKIIESISQLLSVDEISLAIDLTIRISEYELAFALSKSFLKDPSHFLIPWADRCSALGSFDLAEEILKKGYNNETVNLYLGLFISKYSDLTLALELESHYNLPPSNLRILEAKEAEAIGSDKEALLKYILSRNFDSAIAIGLEIMTRNIRNPWDLSQNTKELLHYLKFINLTEIETSRRLKFLCYLLWFCAHDAVLEGLHSTSVSMLNVLLNYCSQVEFPFTEAQIQYQSFIFRLYACDPDSISLLNTLISNDQHDKNAAIDGLIALEKAILETSIWEHWNKRIQFEKLKTLGIQDILSIDENIEASSFTVIFNSITGICNQFQLPSLQQFISKKFRTNSMQSIFPILLNKSSLLLGSKLPVANQREKLYKSYVSNKHIQGRCFYLNESKTSVISISEAIDWWKVNPYSPLMNGDLLIV